ncbi:MAG TPA: hypothetical protein P5268_02825 [Candidatus Marinimicrobia bacterium]|nr:hypothetical protein [Candidatus Neomarinimicrobiota bacterium]HRS52264.1 hypothetical protein [Candidatus Neomarinimicrobiota bacterium]HRU91952.1 hypothetical protein [Candidatus Neomarinimicrobiota bacterium]
MNKNFTSRIAICVTLALILLLAKNIQSASIDSLAYYQTQYNQQLTKLHTLEKNYNKLLNDINAIDAQIIKINNASNLNWSDERKLSRLTARKAEINGKMISVYTELADQRTTLNITFNRYYDFLSKSIDSTINQYSRMGDSRQRQNLSKTLFELIDRRGQLLASQRQFSDQNEFPLPEKEDLVALIAKYDFNDAIRRDISHILDAKIRQIDLMIAAASTEKELRQRLNQLNLEMNVLAGESYPYQGGDYENWGPSATSGKTTYRDLTSNAALPTTTQPVTTADYLPLFQNIPTNDLSLYISQLDSLRRYYQKQLQEINGNK